MRRVLVVDDEENIRLVLRTLLRKSGYEVAVADNGDDVTPLYRRAGLHRPFEQLPGFHICPQAGHLEFSHDPPSF